MSEIKCANCGHPKDNHGHGIKLFPCYVKGCKCNLFAAPDEAKGDKPLTIPYENGMKLVNQIADLESQLQAERARRQDAIDVVLFCPNCKFQHIDKADPDNCETCGRSVREHWAGDGAKALGCVDFKVWTNPPHKSHRCSHCNHVFAVTTTLKTNGVKEI